MSKSTSTTTLPNLKFLALALTDIDSIVRDKLKDVEVLKNPILEGVVNAFKSRMDAVVKLSELKFPTKETVTEDFEKVKYTAENLKRGILAGGMGFRIFADEREGNGMTADQIRDAVFLEVDDAVGELWKGIQALDLGKTVDGVKQTSKAYYLANRVSDEVLVEAKDKALEVGTAQATMYATSGATSIAGTVLLKLVQSYARSPGVLKGAFAAQVAWQFTGACALAYATSDLGEMTRDPQTEKWMKRLDPRSKPVAQSTPMQDFSHGFAKEMDMEGNPGKLN